MHTTVTAANATYAAVLLTIGVVTLALVAKVHPQILHALVSVMHIQGW